jgi:hypothetical protein
MSPLIKKSRKKLNNSVISHSQFEQDIFVLNFLKYQPGYFVDLGCGDGKIIPAGSNSLLLEENGWNGIGIDIDAKSVADYNGFRKTKAFVEDLTVTPITEILERNSAPLVIDYLSYDIDEALKQSLELLDLSKYKFKIIHFEHNLYAQHLPPYEGLKDMAYKKFTEAGYIRFISNLQDESGHNVEDWYAHSELVDTEQLKIQNYITYTNIKNSYSYSND